MERTILAPGRGPVMKAFRVLAALIATATIASALLVVIGLSAPSSTAVSGPRLAAGEDRRAEALIVRGLRGDLEAASAASRSALRTAPYDTAALLRIALIDQRIDGHLDDDGLAALAESYRRAPMDRAIALWRIRFCLENWDRLPEGVRRSVQTEVFGVATEPGHLWPLRARLSHVSNAQGRVVAALWHLRVARMMDRSPVTQPHYNARDHTSDS